jgi:hypothetical protein
MTRSDSASQRFTIEIPSDWDLESYQMKMYGSYLASHFEHVLDDYDREWYVRQ